VVGGKEGKDERRNSDLKIAQKHEGKRRGGAATGGKKGSKRGAFWT